MASYFAETEKTWALAKLIVKGKSPDLAFYRRRTPAMPVPVPLPLDAPDLGGLVPALPATWIAQKNRSLHEKWEVPASLRGKVIRLDTTAFSDQVEAASIAFRFNEHPIKKKKSYLGRLLTETAEGLGIGKAKPNQEALVKPYTYPEAGRDFFLIPIPSDAENCHILVRFSAKAKKVTLVDLQATVITLLEGTTWAREGMEKEP
jgi:hypothetical protein